MRRIVRWPGAGRQRADALVRTRARARAGRCDLRRPHARGPERPRRLQGGRSDDHRGARTGRPAGARRHLPVPRTGGISRGERSGDRRRRGLGRSDRLLLPARPAPAGCGAGGGALPGRGCARDQAASASGELRARRTGGTTHLRGGARTPGARAHTRRARDPGARAEHGRTGAGTAGGTRDPGPLRDLRPRLDLALGTGAAEPLLRHVLVGGARRDGALRPRPARADPVRLRCAIRHDAGALAVRDPLRAGARPVAGTASGPDGRTARAARRGPGTARSRPGTREALGGSRPAAAACVDLPCDRDRADLQRRRRRGDAGACAPGLRRPARRSPRRGLRIYRAAARSARRGRRAAARRARVARGATGAHGGLPRGDAGRRRARRLIQKRLVPVLTSDEDRHRRRGRLWARGRTSAEGSARHNRLRGGRLCGRPHEHAPGRHRARDAPGRHRLHRVQRPQLPELHAPAERARRGPPALADVLRGRRRGRRLRVLERLGGRPVREARACGVAELPADGARLPALQQARSRAARGPERQRDAVAARVARRLCVFAAVHRAADRSAGLGCLVGRPGPDVGVPGALHGRVLRPPRDAGPRRAAEVDDREGRLEELRRGAGGRVQGSAAPLVPDRRAAPPRRPHRGRAGRRRAGGLRRGRARGALRPGAADARRQCIRDRARVAPIDPVPVERGRPAHRHGPAAEAAAGLVELELPPDDRAAGPDYRHVPHEPPAVAAGRPRVLRDFEQNRGDRARAGDQDDQLRTPGLHGRGDDRAGALGRDQRGAADALLRGVLGPRLPRGRRGVGDTSLRAAAAMTASAVYAGAVRHKRLAVKERSFEHAIAMAYVDLDELPTLLGGKLASSRPGVARFRRSDYFGEGDLAKAVREAAGVTVDGPTRVLTQLRSLGRCFNPVSFYYCFNEDEELEALLAEVTNTPWGERQTYVLKGPGEVLKGEAQKQMRVSPFMGMDQTYSWRVAKPGESIAVHIESSESGEKAFEATLALKREELSDRTLRRLTGSSLKTLGLIYSHAAAIRLSGIKGKGGQGALAPAARALAFRAFSRVRSGSLTVAEPDGVETFGAGEPAGLIEVRDSAAWPLLLQGSRGLGEAYARGYWDSPDLVALIRVAALNAGSIDRFRRRLAPVLVPIQAATGTLRANSRTASRKQIAAHYDLGNDLFELMLDPTMSYSSGWFAREEMTLHEAAVAKLELVCERLDLQPDDHLLEIGSGWGALAIHAASTRGCRVTTTTISREQHELAVERVRAAGLEDRVTVLLQDYRDLRGRYDKLVSIEMIEAVGWRNFGMFFRRCSELLEDDGAMLLQAITIDDRAYEVEKASPSFIRTYVFPNGCLPSLEVIARNVARETDMRMVGLHDLTDSYVRTLQQWRTNFDAHTHRLGELGYDERFQRIWRLYLAYVEAGFAERRIGDVQLLLAKPGYRGEPSLLNMRELTASSRNAGPRDASLARAVLPPGPRMASSRSTARTMRDAHSSGATSSHSDVST